MKHLLSFLLSLAISFSFAQQGNVKTYFIKEGNKQVYNIDSADYIRTISTEKNNEDAYDVVEYYKDYTVKRIGNSTKNTFTPNYKGNVISYFKNGKVCSKEPYSNGSIYGVASYYYANDSLRKQISYSLDEKKKRVEKVIALNDSLGHHFLDDHSSGKFKITERDGEVVEGEYLKGLNHGIWKTYNPKKNENYVDEYNAGKYLQGKTIEANGNIITYKEMEVLPEFKGGLQTFSKFLSSNLNYPKEAFKSNTGEGVSVIWSRKGWIYK